MDSVKDDFIITTGILKVAARGMKFRWTSTDPLVTSIGRLVPEQWRHEEPLKFRDSRGNPRNTMDDFNANIDSIYDSNLDSSLSNSYSEDRSSVSCLSDALSELAGDRDDNDGSSDGRAPSENTHTLNDLIDLQTPPSESPIPSFAFSPISPDHDLLEAAFDQPLSQQSLLADLIDINPSPGATDNDSTADIAGILRSTGLGEMTDLDTPPGL